jgi:sec-independent protein translocase protein TatB
MLRSMFGMGGTEILVILIVALLFLGPDKLPEAATKISKGIRDIKKQSRVLQRTIEEDEHIGGAIRDLKSALRGEYEPPRPKPTKPKKQLVEPPESADSTKALPEPGAPGTPEHGAGPDQPAVDSPPQTVEVEAAKAEPSIHGHGHDGDAHGGDAAAGRLALADDAKPALTMPPTAGEPDETVPAAPTASDDAELAAMVKPAPNTIPHKPSSVAEVPEQAEPKHG